MTPVASGARGRVFPQRTKVVCTSILSILLTFPSLQAQTHVMDVQVATTNKLFITILDGEGALNNIRTRTAREPIVQIEDTNHKPLADVSVTFLLKPGETGASGTFGALDVYQTVTDANGIAVGRGLQTNSTTGPFVIVVTAALGILTSEILIHETNTPDGNPLPSHVGPSGAGSGAAGSSPRGPTTADEAAGATVTASRLVPTWLLASGGAAAGSSVGIVELLNSGAAPKPPIRVPEIDPTAGMSCLALLAGLLAILRER